MSINDFTNARTLDTAVNLTGLESPESTLDATFFLTAECYPRILLNVVG